MEPGEQVDRCKYFEGLFSPYIEGELDSVDRKALAQHLHECETCSENFRLSWQAATGFRNSGRRFGSSRKKSGNRRGGRPVVWLLLFFSLVGLIAMAILGPFDSGGRGLREMAQGGGGREQRSLGPKPLIQEEIGRMISVQTRLLEALVDPLRGTQQQVSHAQRGAAMDYFETYQKRSEAWKAQKNDQTGKAFESCFHPLFRAVDAGPGGRSFDRGEFLGSLYQKGIPPVVLVQVKAATRDTLLCQLAWGKRPAFAFLLKVPDSQPGHLRYRLAYLMLSKP
ncbi:MAG TPA: zf-HC2 domain-containing protein [Planctomycetes bacterium]|nr:zf-HC2 domain-containing protein [Planctomycetota bacterium]